MTQPEQQAVGGASDEPIIAAEPTIEDRLVAATEEPPKEDEQQEEAPATPEGDEELPELTEDDVELGEAGDAEEGELEPIPAPASWTTEEKEEFAKLPRALQDVVTRREGEREKFLQTKSQEAKQASAKIEQAALELLQKTHSGYAEALQLLLPEVPVKPSYTLQAQNPLAFAQAMEEHENAVLVRNHIAQELQKARETGEAQEQAVKARMAEISQELLQDRFPEFLDPEKGPELRNQLRSTALALGYSDEQLAQTDAQDILAMKQVSEWKAKADKLDTLMKKQMERVRDGKNPPKITRPGAPQGKGLRENQRYAADREAMRGGDRDATTRVFSRFANT